MIFLFIVSSIKDKQSKQSKQSKHSKSKSNCKPVSQHKSSFSVESGKVTVDRCIWMSCSYEGTSPSPPPLLPISLSPLFFYLHSHKATKISTLPLSPHSFIHQVVTLLTSRVSRALPDKALCIHTMCRMIGRGGRGKKREQEE